MGTHTLDTGANMKTTLDINDSLFEQAKLVSQLEGVTLRALVEQGLRLALKQRSSGQRKLVKLPVFQGQIGLDDAFKDAGWAAIKDEARRR